jgi:HD-GYP domain-containing protein (c-di-GMP phosphodiesterase class II)
LLGKGYPFKTSGVAQDLECRIISVADIFQALSQNRPYRKSMSLNDILADLQQRVSKGELDKEVVEKLRVNAEAYYQLAQG